MNDRPNDFTDPVEYWRSRAIVAELRVQGFAKEIGRLGGRSKSAAKVRAAKKNGKKGGRPAGAATREGERKP